MWPLEPTKTKGMLVLQKDRMPQECLACRYWRLQEAGVEEEKSVDITARSRRAQLQTTRVFILQVQDVARDGAREKEKSPFSFPLGKRRLVLKWLLGKKGRRSQSKSYTSRQTVDSGGIKPLDEWIQWQPFLGSPYVGSLYPLIINFHDFAYIFWSMILFFNFMRHNPKLAVWVSFGIHSLWVGYSVP